MPRPSWRSQGTSGARGTRSRHRAGRQYDGESGHSQIRPRRHERQTPHGINHDRATRSLTRGVVTPGPTASTMPEPSWPNTIGVGRSHSPSRTCRSEWHTPEASIRTRTSPTRGSLEIHLADVDRSAHLRQDGGSDGGHGRHPASIVAGWSHCHPASAGLTAIALPRCSPSTSMPRRSMLTDHPEVIDYLDVIGHQRYGPQVVPRILRMLDRRGLRTTFFVPGSPRHGPT